MHTRRLNNSSPSINLASAQKSLNSLRLHISCVPTFAGFGPASIQTIRQAHLKETSSLVMEAQGREVAEKEAQPPVASTSEIALDRESFKGTYPVLALRIPSNKCTEIRTFLKPYTLARSKLRPIVNDPSSSDHRLYCLTESFKAPEDLKTLPEDVQKAIEAYPAQVYEYPIDYSVFSSEEVLRRLLPEGIEIPQGFETVGHIAHFNLKAEQLPFKALIARVIMDKNPGIKTVVNKLGNIENEFRVLPMELLGGEDRYEAIVKQHGCQFHLDFREVYWNSRLETEHRRLVDTFKEGEVVADMMGGIGPFGIPAAKAGCRVLCNDLNPRSAHWMRVNMKKNKLEKGGKFGCFNMDGRAFIRLLCGHEEAGQVEQWAKDGLLPPAAEFPAPPTGEGILFDHVIMNLPASAVEFLDVFRGVFPRSTWSDRPLPWVHCYTFARGEGEEARQAALASVEEHLGGKLTEEDGKPHAHLVRDVAPNKQMFCVSFRVPRAIGLESHKRPREEGA